MNWSTKAAAAAVKNKKRSILTENNMLIFSIFASEWGSGRKYLKNEGKPPQAQRRKRKGGRAASPSPSLSLQ